MDKKVAFLTLGCKVNSYETDAMEQLFIKSGYKIVKFNEQADIYIVNTCSVTNMADRKSRQMLHKAKKNNSNALVVAVGCYVQAAPEEVMKDDAIDIIVGNNKKKDIVEIVEKYIEDNYSDNIITHNEDFYNLNSVIDINDTKGSVQYEELEIKQTDENTRAYIKIQDGCNQFCSYCIIPYVRGRIRSRKLGDILQEVNSLAQTGYKEVVLTGIHISSYGLDFEKERKKDFNYKYLLEVIKEIAKVDGIRRIRLGSLEPRIITEEFIAELSKIDKVCPHFHLSLQSGCDETLKRMNRKYTTGQFMDGCNILRKYYDNPALTTDIIVGFAGETEEEFDITYDFLNKVNFSQMHIFKYSIRKGTVAEKMPNQVSDRLKNERSKKLIAMSEKNHLHYMNTFTGKEEAVLIEEKVNINDQEYYIGHNERYVKIAVKYDKIKEYKILGEKNILDNTNIDKNDYENTIIKVKVEGVLSDDIMEGTIIG